MDKLSLISELSQLWEHDWVLVVYERDTGVVPRNNLLFCCPECAARWLDRVPVALRLGRIKGVESVKYGTRCWSDHQCVKSTRSP